jgi:hypothetical protein
MVGRAIVNREGRCGGCQKRGGQLAAIMPDVAADLNPIQGSALHFALSLQPPRSLGHDPDTTQKLRD